MPQMSLRRAMQFEKQYKKNYAKSKKIKKYALITQLRLNPKSVQWYN